MKDSVVWTCCIGIGLILFGCHSPVETPDAYQQVLQLDAQSYKQWLESRSDSSKIHWIRPDQKIASEPWLQDLAVLKLALEDAQTGLYRYNTPDQIDSVFQIGRRSLKDSASYLDLFRAIAPVFSVMGNSHAGSGHSKRYKAYRKENLKFIPLRILVHEKRFYVRQNLSTQDGPEMGDEVLSINGQSVEEIGQQLLTCMKSDGKNQTLKWRVIQDYFPYAYSNFIDQPDSFQITYRDSMDQLVNAGLRARSKNFLDSVRGTLEPPQPHKRPLRYQAIDSLSTSILTIRSFNKNVLTHFDIEFEKEIDSIFQEIKTRGHKKLIVDLRDNAGGWTGYGRYLVSYLVDQPQDYIQGVYTKKIEGFSFEPLIQNHAEIEDTMLFEAVDGNRLEWKNYPNLRIESLPDHGFDGKLMVLTNGPTMSCAGVVSAVLREHTEAVFLGEESGTGSGGTDGITLSLVLPHSGIGITLSLGLYEYAPGSKQPDYGVFPDYPINTSPEDVFLGRDPVLERALREPL